ncbi:DNA polymerase III subunit gamma/tau [Thermogemmata fonticola]|uniref:DNA polymerase III subunit gamma/tau n=1 Tax=Thermogemmata fonticola TaxID=2755323 RepID=A0A7V8VBK2_9BACT|nr:DNA polymerase III subunit gamma/tau [Thermogemmata fonticola]MBA2225028.1 DNA polymerase III subunit gamma/tau [Thermogemmata fonticola]
MQSASSAGGEAPPPQRPASPRTEESAAVPVPAEPARVTSTADSAAARTGQGEPAVTAPAPYPAPSAPGHYTVMARRYRPQQFADLIGQEHVAQALVQALESGRVAHAYLFTGARGVGKTSTARILAKALNCVHGPTPYPCDTCDICQAIATGEDVDVVEIDGASNRGIEDARDLRQSVGFRPVRSRFKIFIIDEVHMLTREAFNALLKTLEEPPPHVKFIFATTEVQKIPITILSRCQRFDFAHVRPAQIAQHLQRIVQKEGREAEPEALRLVARKAAGSMRDAQSLLDQLLAAESGCLTVQRVRQVLGLSSEEQVLQLAEAVFRRDAAGALQLLQQWYDQGLQAGELIDQLIAHWRNLMLLKCGGFEVRELPVDTGAIDALRQQVEQVSLDTILAGLDVWTAVKARLRDAYQAQILLEMAVVRLARMEELLSVGALWQQLMQGGGSLGGPAGGSSPASNPAASRSSSGPRTGTMPPAGTAPPTRSAPSASSGSSIGAKRMEGLAASEPSGPIPLTPETVAEVWSECLRRLTDRFPILANHLKQALPPAISGPNTVVIRFPAPYNLAYEACSQNEHFARRLEETLLAVTGQPVAVRYERVPTLGGSGSAGEASSGLAGLPASGMVPPGPGSASGSDPRRPWLDWPLFRKAIETLDAQIIRVDEGFQPRPPATTHEPPRPSDNGEQPPETNSEPDDEG